MSGLRTWLLLVAVAALSICTSRAELIIEDGGGDDGGTINVPKPDGGTTVAGPGQQQPQQKQDPREILYFTNGDSLRGSLGGVGEGGTIAWQRPDVEGDMAFTQANLLGMRLRRGFGPMLDADFSRIELTNGDAVFGRILNMNAETLQLATPYGGVLKVRVSMIDAIYPGRSQEPALFVGPGRIEDWVINSGNQPWFVRGGKLSGNSGYVGRDVNLPDLAHLSMDVDWNGRAPNFMIAMYTDSPKNTNSHSYNLTFNGQTLYMNRNVQNSGQQQLGNHPMSELGSMDSMKLEVLLDRKNHAVTVLIDGKLVKTWNDPKEFPGDGSSIIIYAHDNSVTMNFSNIRVTRWDGKIPQEGADEAKTDDMIAFANDDRIHGSLKSIEEGKAIFATKFAPGLEVPLERIASIQLAQTPKRPRPRLEKDDVQLFFANGSRLTVKLKSLTERTITGSSENFGDVEFRADAFVGIRFNIYKSVKKDDKDAFESHLEAFLASLLTD